MSRFDILTQLVIGEIEVRNNKIGMTFFPVEKKVVFNPQ